MTTPSPERDKALDAALAQIDKQFGKGSIMRMGEKGTMAIQAVPTGALPLDLALGVGGLPRGRVVEIYGPESSGKSTLAMHVVAEAQRNGGICAYVDAEHAMDPVYAKAIGVDIDQLLISQPDTGEQALEIADGYARESMLLGESACLSRGEHRAGLRGELDAQRHRLQLGEGHQVHGRLGSPGPSQDASRQRTDRRHMARSNQVDRTRARIGECPQGPGAILCRYPTSGEATCIHGDRGG